MKTIQKIAIIFIALIALGLTTHAQTALGDGMSNPTVSKTGCHDLVFNPVTGKWDRMRGDATNGVWVNVKTMPLGGGGDGKIVDGAGAGEADVIGSNPAGSEQGLVTRNIPSGTQPVSAASLPLPSGACTEATLATLNGKVPALGQATMANSAPVVIASNQGAVPVSGTIAATQSGTWTVQPGNTANTTAWKTDGSAVTQPISAAALPLPSGASTEATLSTLNGKVPSLGQATMANSAPVVIASNQGAVPVSGTIAATQSGTWTVQPGNTANTTAWKIDGSAVTQPISGTVTANAGTNLNTSNLLLDATLGLAQASTTSGQKGPLIQGAVTTAAPTYTTAQTSPFSLNTSGGLRTEIASALPAGANVIGALAANQSGNIAQYGGSAVVTGGVSGTVGVGGLAAQDAATSGNPVLVGLRASTTLPTAMSAGGDVVTAWADLNGAVVSRDINLVTPFSCGLTNIGTTLTECKAAPGSGLSLYITDIVPQSNTGTAGFYTLRYGTGVNCGTGTGNLFFASATALLQCPANVSTSVGIKFSTPIKVTANNAVCVLGVITNTTNIQINGFTAP